MLALLQGNFVTISIIIPYLHFHNTLTPPLSIKVARAYGCEPFREYNVQCVTHLTYYYKTLEMAGV